MSKKGYPAGKLSDAINKLVSHPGQIKERLNACIIPFAGFNARPFSESVEQQYKKVLSTLTKVPKEEAGQDGQWKASIATLSEKEAEGLANDMLGLFYDVIKEHHKELLGG